MENTERQDELIEKLVKMGATIYEGEVVAPCPVCQEGERDHTKFHMLLNCGESRVLVAFCRYCCNRYFKFNRKTWWHLVCNFYDFNDASFKALPGENCRLLWGKLEITAKEKKRIAAAAVIDLNTVYNDLLHRLTLTDAHKKWLEKRGIDPNWAVMAGYRSTDYVTTSKNFEYVDLKHPLFNSLLTTHGDLLQRVPGFSYIKTHPILGLRKEAILIPCRDYFGRIQAIKQRMLDGKAGRMRWLASCGNLSPAAINRPHYPLGVNYPKKWNSLWITEGERKADCHYLHTGQATIGIPGVGCYLQAMDTIKNALADNGRVILAFDQDDAGKETTEALKAILQQERAVTVASWGGGKKGLDDAILKGLEITLTDYPIQKLPSITETKGTPTPNNTTSSLLTKDDEVIDWLTKNGPTLRDNIPARMGTIARLINAKRLVVRYSKEGQVLRVAT